MIQQLIVVATKNQVYIDAVLTKIFDAIRDVQSAKKNIPTEKMELEKLSDFEPTTKFITSDDIILMILSRLIHKDNIEKQGAPICFIQYVNTLRKTEDEIKDFILDCEADIKRMLFDKNNASSYWKLFFEIYGVIKYNPSLSVSEIYDIIGAERFSIVKHLNFNSAKYFIALIKDGIKK